MSSTIYRPFELAMVYEEQATGRRVSIGNVSNIRPFSFESLLKTIGSTGGVNIPIVIDDASISDSNNAWSVENKLFQVSCDLESNYSSDTIGIVNGGWLPSSLAAQKRTLLLDRCVVSKIYERFLGGAKHNGLSNDFIDFLESGSVKLNPLLYALEGNKRSHLSSSEVHSQIEEACKKLQRALPAALIQPNIDQLWGLASALINRTSQGIDKKIQFLKAIAPRLASPIAKNNQKIIWSFVLEQQMRYKISPSSLVVLAVLSAVFCEQSGKNSLLNPAKRIFKFKASYSDSMAYNALSDLRALELYAALPTMFIGEDFALCTADSALALFGVGIDPTATAQIFGPPILNFSINSRLMPIDAQKLLSSGIQ